MMNKGRENNKALIKPPSNDLLVCFPTRAHLTLMQKPTHSPSRPNYEPNKRHIHHLKKINTRAATSFGGGPNSPLIWAKDNQIRGGGPEMSEPTSPKVTCAGQIKVRPRSLSTTSCRNWQSVMEEIEKIHNSSKQKKKSSLVETFGFKKDVMSFLTCLRNVRFDFRCFGSFPQQDLSSDDEEDEEDDNAYEEEDSFKEIIDEDYKVNNGINGINGINDNDDNSNNAVFSKWFMVLQENKSDDNTTNKCLQEELENDDCTPAVPPPNALLLMRCRSAPAKGWLLEEKEHEVKDDNKEESEEEKEINKKKRETLSIVMKYDTEFYKLSNDVAQETWVVGEFKDTFSRSTSCRR